MSKVKVYLDAMIPREDFYVQSESIGGQRIQTIGVEQLEQRSIVVKSLRKPDFQRETNHWDVNQLVTFLKSYVDNELIPSVILWKSDKNMFIIDGAHRISALRAWIEDDYGDRNISLKYYGHDITEDQKKSAEKIRKRINNEIGPYSLLRGALEEPEGIDEVTLGRSSVLTSRAFDLQWVEGDASKAETSFFKINTQGTPLHKTEERLLRNRRKPIAITARAIARAGTGNKYWSHFEKGAQEEIEGLARELFNLLFQPELSDPIKTLDLPLAGTTSPIEALNLLMDFIEHICGKKADGTVDDEFDSEDIDGEQTVRALKRCLKVVKRITGNGGSSLGMHPAVYFYNHRGKHSQHLFLAIVSLINKSLNSNDKKFFKKYTEVRSQLEEALVKNKDLLSQAITNIYSGQRVPKLAAMFEELICKPDGEISEESILSSLGLEVRIISNELETKRGKFSKDTKAQILLRESLDSAIRCPICNGFLDPSKAVSYDHIERFREGGGGHAENGQLTHPYCNSGVKC